MKNWLRKRESTKEISIIVVHLYVFWHIIYIFVKNTFRGFILGIYNELHYSNLLSKFFSMLHGI